MIIAEFFKDNNGWTEDKGADKYYDNTSIISVAEDVMQDVVRYGKTDWKYAVISTDNGDDWELVLSNDDDPFIECFVNEKAVASVTYRNGEILSKEY